MRSLAHYVVAVLVLLVLVVAGCRDSDRDKDTETAAAHDNGLAELLYKDVFTQIHTIAIMDSLLNDTGLFVRYDPCIKRVWFSDTMPIFPIDVIIDYGDDAGFCKDGRNRKGRILATFTGKYKTPGTNVTITFENYTMDDFQVEGTQTLSVNGFNESGKRLYTMSVDEGVITGLNIDIDWQSTKNMEWSGGASTEDDITDDQFLVTNIITSGRNTKGNTFTASSKGASVMVWALDCSWITSGIQEMFVPNLSARIIDYGTGSCDNVVIATRDATDLEVKLP